MENLTDYGTLDLQRIFENLQAPDLSGGMKSKAEMLDGNNAPDFSLAYLGPQIWNNGGMSDEFQLEPINLDDLLDETSLNEGLGDLTSLINGDTPQEQEKKNKTEEADKDSSQLKSFSNAQANFIIAGQKQATVTTITDESQEATNGATEVTPAADDAKFDYEPNITEMMISTPLTEVEPTSELFDPRKRAFTDDELKPQPIIRKAKKVYVPSESKDEKYWQKREKNNAAAKRSREARRIKENQIVMRTKFLEKENDSLRGEVKELRAEVSRLMKIVEGRG